MKLRTFNNWSLELAILGVLFLVATAGADEVRDEKLAQIKFPITELNDCSSKEECKSYCDSPENFNACLAFGQKHGLMTKQEADVARRVKTTGGPGGCRGEKECRLYCEDESRADECLAFAEKHDLIPRKELELARKVLKSGGPGGCRGESSCRQFCSDPGNFEACFSFAKENGLIEEAEQTNFRPEQESGRQHSKDFDFSNLPPEAALCLKEKLGSGLPKEISGGAFDNPERIEGYVRDCLRSTQARQQELENRRPPSREEEEQLRKQFKRNENFGRPSERFLERPLKSHEPIENFRGGFTETPIPEIQSEDKPTSLLERGLGFLGRLIKNLFR